MTAFWNIAPCSLGRTERRFRGSYCLHYQCDEYSKETTRRYNGEVSHRHTRRRENLISHRVRHI
jgi:hypothetical protein